MKDEVVRGTVYRMVGRELAKRGMASGDNEVWDMIDLVADRLDTLGAEDRQLLLPGIAFDSRAPGREEGVIQAILVWAEREEWLPGVLAGKLRT